ncbi:FecR domain-containing protein [Opitutus sp. ER46]|uniref:FecR family protein n=1 Tax=Opitutus sp. ER46 TaxID=2161864 RepID=UPI000D31C75E|nr:FecR domain-containing protein [Opitutus sp. ER46]PTX98976.1 hypothetical protein DB354_02855 [Opitutus sp. ER46]
MSLSHSTNRNADDQAARWAAKLDGGPLSATERNELDAWLAQHPDHRILLSEYCQFSTDLEAQLPLLVASGQVAMPETVHPRRIGRRVLWFAGALTAAAAALTVVVWSGRPAVQTDAIATSFAERKTLRLADGTAVEVNARTSLLVNLDRTERRVRMADGQAFFTVAKDPSRPFIVETPAGSVRVTGTVFDVHAENEAELEVTIVEGSVQVRPSSSNARPTPAPVSLIGGQQLIAAPDSVSCRSLAASEIEDALAWRHGEIVFTGATLDRALARFSRFHGRNISAAPEIASLRVGGRFRLADLDGFLNAIEAFLPVQVSRDSSGAIAVRSRPSR